MNDRTYGTGWKKRVTAAVLALMIAILGAMAYLCASAWQEYRNTVVNNQKEQMLLTTQAVSRSMGVFFQDLQAELATLSQSFRTFQAEGPQKGLASLFETYTQEHESFVYDLRLTSSDGAVLVQFQEEEITQVFLDTVDQQGQRTLQAMLSNGHPCLALGTPCGPDQTLWLLVDLTDYYQNLISGIQVGSNGYILVKNSQGIILMHPDEDQWGIHVIQGRQALYPEADLSSLGQLVEAQNQGGTGVMEYTSYWWMDSELPRVQKVSAWAPVALGDDFLVVSTVIDYSDIDIPIAQNITRMGIAVLVVTLSTLVLALFLGKLLLDRRRSAQEIAYLKDLNNLLEQLHRSEETLAHQQRLQIIGTMTGGIAHEFNNLLTPILGHADLIQLEAPEGSELADSAREIADAAARCKEIIQQLSSLSRKNVETSYQLLPVGPVIHRILNTVQSICPSSITFHRSLDLGEHTILGNETQLQQVILNLCVNAFHAMAQTEGTLTVLGQIVRRTELEAEGIALESRTWTDYVRLDFTDTGCGMSSATLEQIFDPFFTTKPSGQGTGLGLSLAQQIVRSHRGILYAESTLGKGSVFHLLLPVSQSEGAPAEPLQANPIRPLRVLLTGENAKLLGHWEKYLMEHELSVRAFPWSEAAEHLARTDGDALVIDCGQHFDQVLELCMSLQGSRTGLQKLLLVDRLTREVLQAKQRGIVQGVLEKPVSDAELLRTLSS